MAYTTPRTWVTGELVTAAMLNQQIRDNENAAFPLGVDAWTTFTPTLTQSVTVTKTVVYGKYQRIGRLIVAQVFLTVTGAGTAGQFIIVGLPVAAVYNTQPQEVGTGTVFDTSANQAWKGPAILQGASTVFFRATGASTSVLGAADMTLGLAVGDNVSYSVMYESAT